MFIATFHSESGDDYLIGPFPEEPSQADCMAVFRGYNPEEAEYAEELGMQFRIKKLPDAPGVIDFQV